MHPKSGNTEFSLRSRLARGILSDAHLKCEGRRSRIDKITTSIALSSLLAGFLLASDTTTHITGWIVFFGSFGLLLGVSASGLLPFVQRMRDRLGRCGLESADQMRLPELLAVRWAITEQARQTERG